MARWWGQQDDDFPFEDETVTRLAVLSGGEVIGMVQFFEEPDPDARHADIDIFLAPSHHGRGIGTETVRALVRLLTEQRGHHRVTLSTSVEDTVAIRCYEKAGFRRVGVLERAGRDQRTGEWADELLFEYVVSP